jgi:hypothetical protein
MADDIEQSVPPDVGAETPDPALPAEPGAARWAWWQHLLFAVDALVTVGLFVQGTQAAGIAWLPALLGALGLVALWARFRWGFWVVLAVTVIMLLLGYIGALQQPGNADACLVGLLLPVPPGALSLGILRLGIGRRWRDRGFWR